ncbi:MAG: hypothetical protein H6719_06915 [Sandaracinaceae bacterium]|nr:hypothetical protein [Sandaracinaceae bacterium]
MAPKRLFHTLVVSSVMTLDGCTISHATTADAGPGDPPDGGADGLDAGADGGTDAAIPDAAIPDAGFDAAIPDAGWDAGDARFCEPGWPTTKGMVCVDIGDGVVECCRLWLDDGSMDSCCIGVPE